MLDLCYAHSRSAVQIRRQSSKQRRKQHAQCLDVRERQTGSVLRNCQNIGVLYLDCWEYIATLQRAPKRSFNNHFEDTARLYQQQKLVQHTTCTRSVSSCELFQAPSETMLRTHAVSTGQRKMPVKSHRGGIHH